MFESVETGRRGCVGVDVDNLAALDVLEKSHCCVARVVLHHCSVVLSLAHVVSWVLEDASLTIRTLRWVVQEILADRCQVLTAEAFFLLKLVLSVSEAAALLLLAVFARLSIEPELAEFSLDLFLPSVLDLGSSSGSALRGARAGSHGRALRLP